MKLVSTPVSKDIVHTKAMIEQHEQTQALLTDLIREQQTTNELLRSLIAALRLNV